MSSGLYSGGCAPLYLYRKHLQNREVCSYAGAMNESINTTHLYNYRDLREQALIMLKEVKAIDASRRSLSSSSGGWQNPASAIPITP